MRIDHPKVQLGADGTLLLNFGSYGQEVEVAAISGDGRRVLTVREVGKAQVWDIGSGEQVGVICPDTPLAGTVRSSLAGGATFEVFIEAAALDRDGSFALLGLNDGTAGVFRVADGSRLAVLHPPDESPAAQFGVIRAVAYSADFSLVLVGFEGRRVGAWSADGQRRVAFLAAPSGGKLVGKPFVRDTLVSSVATSPDGKWLFMGCADRSAALWELAGQRLVFEALEHAEQSLALFDDESGLGWATSAGNIWSCSGDGPPRKLLTSDEHWSEVAFGRDRLLARTRSGAVSLWTFSGRRTPQIEPSDPVMAMWSDHATSLGFHGVSQWHYPEGGKRLVVCVDGRRVIIDREARIVSVRFSQAGDAVGVGGWTNTVDLWSTADGRRLGAYSAPGGVEAFDLSPDGRLIAVGELGSGGGRFPRSVLVYDTASGKLLHHLKGHEWQISQVAFSSDARKLASLSDELIVWNLDRPGPLGRRLAFRGKGDGAFLGVRFLSDGRLLVLSRGGARLLDGSRLGRELEVPIDYRTRWCLSHDERFLSVAINQGVFRTELASGDSNVFQAPILRPERIPGVALARKTGFRAGAALWRTGQGLFLHQGDGPRGWVQPLTLSSAAEVVLPTESGAALLCLTPEPTLVGTLPFEGKLRASRVLDDCVVLVNEQGTVFRHPKPR